MTYDQLNEHLQINFDWTETNPKKEISSGLTFRPGALAGTWTSRGGRAGERRRRRSCRPSRKRPPGTATPSRPELSRSTSSSVTGIALLYQSDGHHKNTKTRAQKMVQRGGRENESTSSSLIFRTTNPTPHPQSARHDINKRKCSERKSCSWRRGGSNLPPRR